MRVTNAASNALDIFKYQVAKFIGGYAAAMNGVDVIVFTAGVGENSATTRQGVCDYLGYLGITIDAEANGKRGEEIEITTADSKVKGIRCSYKRRINDCKRYRCFNKISPCTFDMEMNIL